MYSTMTHMVLNCTGDERKRILELRVTQLDEQYDELGKESSLDWRLSSPSSPEQNRSERFTVALALGELA